MGPSAGIAPNIIPKRSPAPTATSAAEKVSPKSQSPPDTPSVTTRIISSNDPQARLEGAGVQPNIRSPREGSMIALAKKIQRRKAGRFGSSGAGASLAAG